MPTVLILRGFRFFFFSGEGSEPPHIHIEHGDKVAKYWLSPLELAESEGFRSHELTKLSQGLGDGASDVVFGEMA